MPFTKYNGAIAAETAAPVTHLGSTAAVETLQGSAALEAFWMGEGDTAVGAGGDDTFYFQGHNLKIIEEAGGGVDKIVAWNNVDLSAYANIENVNVSGDNLYAAGNALDNIIEGGAGGQQLYGGAGYDVLAGGAGRDVFIVLKGEGSDVIQDFNVAEDKLRLKAGFNSFEQVKARMSQDGADVRLDLGDGEGVIFRNTSVGQFTADNFQLELDWSRVGQLTFAEEFNAPISIWDLQSNPNGVWRPDLAYQGSQGAGSYALLGNGETQIYTSPYFRDHPGDFSESGIVNNGDGTHSLVARYTTNPEVTSFGSNITSGYIMTRHSAAWAGEGDHKGFSQTYGYFEMRADLSEVKGTWGAFWMTGDDWSWPPELDIMENPIGDPNLSWTTVHSNATGSHTSQGQANFIPHHKVGFHTYSALWTPETVTFFVDNVEVFRVATPADMHKPMNLIANLATGGWAGSTPAADMLPAEMKIDYIRAYALPGQTGGQPTPPTGGAPSNLLTAKPGGDRVIGTAADEIIRGSDGQDYLRGGEGADRLEGGAAFDDVHGNQGDDVAYGGDGDDWVVGGKDNDQLFGEEGLDVVYGNLGSDTVEGGAGADVVRGGQGDDIVRGGAGDDWLAGDRGADTLEGGQGADIFHTFAEADSDRVLDFNFAEGDRVNLLPGTQYSVQQVGADTVIDMGGSQMVLVNVQLSSLGDGWLFGA